MPETRKYPRRSNNKRKYGTSKTKLNIPIQIEGGAAAHASSLPRDEYRFLNKLDNSPLFYRAGDYFANLTPNKMKLCKNMYESLINKTVMNSTTTLGFEVARNGGVGEEYIFTFLNLPLCWQEIVILLYLSLKLHHLVENNSRVVSLGESPSKLVFIQELLAIHPSYKPVLEKYGFATNVEYTFFPASRLLFGTSEILDPARDISTYIHQIDERAKVVNDRSWGAPRWNDILTHFLDFKMDPAFIIANGKNMYIQDRCESYNSICHILTIYNKLCYMQNITQQQRLELFKRLYILGFDSKNLHDDARNQTDRIKIERVNIFFYQIITGQRNNPAPDEYHFIQKNYYYSKQYSLPFPYIYPNSDTLRSTDFNIFMSQHYLLNKVIKFLTLPEDSFNNVRCIRSCGLNDNDCIPDIRRNLHLSGELHIKEPAPLGTNCNLVNFCLMIFINELGDEYIENLILSLETINEDILFYSNDHTFDTLNDEISEIATQQTYNSNIFNNILNNQFVIKKINEKVDQFLRRDGLLSPCKYMPFTFQKKRPNKGKSHRPTLPPLQFSSPSPTPTRRRPPRQRYKPSP
jgi:hypothetical protein